MLYSSKVLFSVLALTQIQEQQLKVLLVKGKKFLPKQNPKGIYYKNLHELKKRILSLKLPCDCGN